MQSRSSRFFIVLLHLVGVSHHLRTQGIVGVQPWPIILEEIHLPDSLLLQRKDWQVHAHQQQHQQQAPNQSPSSQQNLTIRSCSSCTNDEKNNALTHGENHPPPIHLDQPLVVWLQDSHDGACLGPTGNFVECGDATVWLVSPSEPLARSVPLLPTERKRRRRVRPFHSVVSWLSRLGQPLSHREEEEAERERREQQEAMEDEQMQQRNQQPGWTFQVVEYEATTVDEGVSASTSSASSSSSSQTPLAGRRDSLFSFFFNRPKQQFASECLSIHPQNNRVQVERCRSWWPHHRSTWYVTSQGNALQSHTRLPITVATEDESQQQTKKKQFMCLWRGGPDESDGNGSSSTSDRHQAKSHRNAVRLDVCTTGDFGPSSTSVRGGGHLVQFSLVRYRAVAAPIDSLSPQKPQQRPLIPSSMSSISVPTAVTDSFLSSSTSDDGSELTMEEHDTTAAGAASAFIETSFLDVSLPSSSSRDIAHTHATCPSPPHVLPLERRHHSLASQAPPSCKMKKKTFTPIRPESRPIDKLLLNANPLTLEGKRKTSKEKPRRGRKNAKTANQKVDDGDDSDDPASTLSYKKVGRMEVHPYIAAAKDEVWTDPQTGLTYNTDLCRYLGHDRKEHGRHTLMGVGQYRKGFVIKVYGIAYYVSKRDALADPVLETYAGLSAEELRSRPDFYYHLRNMGQGNTGDARFDRTLLLKTNMQLSAETMRSSLGADWKMLTDEAKETLISSSMEPRPADDAMLKLIQSPENPSRCSCSQVAPPEYEANPTCCARGTELAFTWRKTGELEVCAQRASS